MQEFSRLGTPGLNESQRKQIRSLLRLYYQHIPLDWFWQTTLPVTVGTSTARVLGPEAQILHLCLHIFQHRGQAWAFSLRLLHDIAQVLTHYRAQIDWEMLLQNA